MKGKFNKSASRRCVAHPCLDFDPSSSSIEKESQAIRELLGNVKMKKSNGILEVRRVSSSTGVVMAASLHTSKPRLSFKCVRRFVMGMTLCAVVLSIGSLSYILNEHYEDDSSLKQNQFRDRSRSLYQPIKPQQQQHLVNNESLTFSTPEENQQLISSQQQKSFIQHNKSEMIILEQTKGETISNSSHICSDSSSPSVLCDIYNRAKHFQTDICQPIINNYPKQLLRRRDPALGLDLPDLPPFGILQDIRSSSNQQCEMPPSTMCESQDQYGYIIVVMAYRPDRLAPLALEIQDMPNKYSLMKEVVLVWNGEEPLESSVEFGPKLLLQLATNSTHPLRIFNARQEPYEFGNSLLNRYHPAILEHSPKIDALLYFDDDGPFWSDHAITAGYHLWKRNSNVQVASRCRPFVMSPRQREEQRTVLSATPQAPFISHCRSEDPSKTLDVVSYDTHFKFVHAHMALPSGMFLHRAYLCWIWHSVFQTSLHPYVNEHPVHPDDIAVSIIVSQLSQKSPQCYPRKTQQETFPKLPTIFDKQQQTKELSHTSRRLMWKDTSNWFELRSTAVNTLVAYFGSLTVGSLGYCHERGNHILSVDTHDCQSSPKDSNDTFYHDTTCSL